MFEIFKNWEVAIDGIQICLCLLIILMLIRNGVNRGHIASQTKTKRKEASFDSEMYTEVVKQQANQAFDHIAESIATERRNLQRIMQISRGDGKCIDGSKFPDQLSSFKLDESPLLTANQDTVLCRSRIQKWADKGMSAQKISDKLKIPMGEVELIMNLNSNDHWNH